MSAIRRPDLSRLHAKATVKCECGLVQFQTGEKCRRCKAEFEEREEAAVLAEPIPAAKPKLLPFAKIGGPMRDGHPFSTLNLTKATGHPIDQKVSAAVWLLRVSQGFTQLEIAEHVGRPRTHLSKLERGKGCYVSTFCQYAGALGVTPYGLLVIAEAIQ